MRAGSVDAVITSPPYLNAIDYLRGHRLSLVWLGYRLGELQSVRSTGIGAERRPDAGADRRLIAELTGEIRTLRHLPTRSERMVERYALDVHDMLVEMRRVLKEGGKAVLVVGNSCLSGVFVENSRIVTTAASRAGFNLVASDERPLPPARRYLPPPSDREKSDLQKRMRTESVLTLVRR
jgi:DNA modification methylase